jgi:hypothetical protein
MLMPAITADFLIANISVGLNTDTSYLGRDVRTGFHVIQASFGLIRQATMYVELPSYVARPRSA